MTPAGSTRNTAAKSWELAGGLAYVDGPLNIGVSVTRHDALYGVPIRFSGAQVGLHTPSEVKASMISRS